jgi:hypothetical protein
MSQRISRQVKNGLQAVNGILVNHVAVTLYRRMRRHGAAFLLVLCVLKMNRCFATIASWDIAGVALTMLRDTYTGEVSECRAN